ncbi:MAG: hypothetical protein ACJ746_23265 [Bryobacteraceae bacterium]
MTSTETSDSTQRAWWFLDALLLPIAVPVRVLIVIVSPAEELIYAMPKRFLQTRK